MNNGSSALSSAELSVAALGRLAKAPPGTQRHFLPLTRDAPTRLDLAAVYSIVRSYQIEWAISNQLDFYLSGKPPLLDEDPTEALRVHIGVPLINALTKRESTTTMLRILADIAKLSILNAHRITIWRAIADSIPPSERLVEIFDTTEQLSNASGEPAQAWAMTLVNWLNTGLIKSGSIAPRDAVKIRSVTDTSKGAVSLGTLLRRVKEARGASSIGKPPAGTAEHQSVTRATPATSQREPHQPTVTSQDIAAKIAQKYFDLTGAAHGDTAFERLTEPQHQRIQWVLPECHVLSDTAVERLAKAPSGTRRNFLPLNRNVHIELDPAVVRQIVREIVTQHHMPLQFALQMPQSLRNYLGSTHQSVVLDETMTEALRAVIGIPLVNALTSRALTISDGKLMAILTTIAKLPILDTHRISIWRAMAHSIPTNARLDETPAGAAEPQPVTGAIPVTPRAEPEPPVASVPKEASPGANLAPLVQTDQTAASISGPAAELLSGGLPAATEQPASPADRAPIAPPQPSTTDGPSQPPQPPTTEHMVPTKQETEGPSQSPRAIPTSLGDLAATSLSVDSMASASARIEALSAAARAWSAVPVDDTLLAELRRCAEDAIEASREILDRLPKPADIAIVRTQMETIHGVLGGASERMAMQLQLEHAMREASLASLSTACQLVRECEATLPAWVWPAEATTTTLRVCEALRSQSLDEQRRHALGWADGLAPELSVYLQDLPMGEGDTLVEKLENALWKRQRQAELEHRLESAGFAATPEWTERIRKQWPENEEELVELETLAARMLSGDTWLSPRGREQLRELARESTEKLRSMLDKLDELGA